MTDGLTDLGSLAAMLDNRRSDRVSAVLNEPGPAEGTRTLSDLAIDQVAP